MQCKGSNITHLVGVVVKIAKIDLKGLQEKNPTRGSPRKKVEQEAL